MKDNFQKTIETLYSRKEENIQRLSKGSYEELFELRRLYFQIYTEAEEEGNKEATRIRYLKYLIVDEAIEVKVGNEAEVWDFMS